MKLLTFLILTTAILTTSCKSQEQLVFESQDVVKETKEEEKKEQEVIPTIALDSILGDTKWNQLKTANAINVYRVDSVLVDEKTMEYGRKVIPLNALSKDNVTSFLSEVTSLQNYPVVKQPLAGFNPNLQFEMCTENCELSLLLDSKINKVGFINLEGQEVVSISEKLKTFLLSQPTTNKKTN